MSQTGSYNLAKMGWSSDRILNFYYTNTQLQKLRPEHYKP
jgi:SpoIID/LytB domain protein